MRQAVLVLIALTVGFFAGYGIRPEPATERETPPRDAPHRPAGSHRIELIPGANRLRIPTPVMCSVTVTGGSKCWLVAKTGDSEWFVERSADEDGGVHFKGIPAGTYRVSNGKTHQQVEIAGDQTIALR